MEVNQVQFLVKSKGFVGVLASLNSSGGLYAFYCLNSIVLSKSGQLLVTQCMAHHVMDFGEKVTYTQIAFQFDCVLLACYRYSLCPC